MAAEATQEADIQAAVFPVEDAPAEDTQAVAFPAEVPDRAAAWADGQADRAVQAGVPEVPGDRADLPEDRRQDGDSGGLSATAGMGTAADAADALRLSL